MPRARPLQPLKDSTASVDRAPPSARLVQRIAAANFGIPLGLAGLAGSWRAAHAAWSIPALPGELLFALAGAAWLFISLLYAWKWLAAREAACAEARHPVQCCFIGLGGVATLIIAQGLIPYSRLGAFGLCALGASFTLGFGIWRTGRLWQGDRKAEATTPVLYLPLVAGGLVTAATLGALGLRQWAALAFGGAFFSWLAIESVVLHRLYTVAEMPAPLRPTLGIVLAPPAVGALAYLATGGDPWSIIPQALVGYAMLLALLLARLWPWIAQQPFSLSYWGLTFGVTALPTALIRMSIASPSRSFEDLGFMLFLVANVIVAFIAVRTLALWMAFIVHRGDRPASSIKRAPASSRSLRST